MDDGLKEENSMKKLALALVLVVALISQCALAEAEEPVTLRHSRLPQRCGERSGGGK